MCSFLLTTRIFTINNIRFNSQIISWLINQWILQIAIHRFLLAPRLFQLTILLQLRISTNFHSNNPYFSQNAEVFRTRMIISAAPPPSRHINISSRFYHPQLNLLHLTWDNSLEQNQIRITTLISIKLFRHWIWIQAHFQSRITWTTNSISLIKYTLMHQTERIWVMRSYSKS